jgi:transaldolase/glucose-6-phosphate isomerase
MAARIGKELSRWDAEHCTERLWSRDASLWTNTDEAKWLGWLTLAGEVASETRTLAAFAEEVKGEGFSHAMVLGMGGSSLCPEVLSITFGPQPGFPQLLVLDSTDPAQVLSFEKQAPPPRTLYVVASKSGSTLEPNIFMQYFYDRAVKVAGTRAAGRQFVAITDPGSAMQSVAEGLGFRRIFFGKPDVGGRFSALSNFGMLPAAVMGLDVSKFLTSAQEMTFACRTNSASENPGVRLGVTLGVLAKLGRDKLTVFTSAKVRDLGAWLEQLVAESTGKNGKAIIPLDRERSGPPSVYGEDRVFVHVGLAGEGDEAQSNSLAELESAGHPVIRITLKESMDLGQEFFRWEVATSAACAILGVNPFNQPDVEASKVETRQLTSAFESTGSLPQEQPFMEEKGIRLFANPENVTAIRQLEGESCTLAGCLRAHFARLQRKDYFALLAYITMSEQYESLLQDLRHLVRDRFRVATCLGFGPRFLHSTGQAYKGGPNLGVFLQITSDAAADVAVPGQKFTFGIVKAAQARGDFEVLAARGRRALRAHLGQDVKEGLQTLLSAAREALADERHFLNLEH